MSALSRIYRPPLIGVLAYIIILLYLPIAHTLLVLMRMPWGAHSWQYGLMSLIAGLVGVVVMWKGLERDEAPATWLGFAGGMLIWVGWFEFTFEFFSDLMAVESLLNPDGTLAVPAGLILLQATVLIFIAMMVFVIANKDSRCRLVMWLHRNLPIRPGKMTPGYKRPISRITAMELVYVTWFCYLVNVAMYDHRLLGINHIGTKIIFFTFLIWSIYLVFKLAKIRTLAAAIRYAIPTTNISWLCVEVGGRWGLFTEIWIHPLDYALEMTLVVIAFAVAAVIISMTPERAEGQPAK